MNTRLPLRLLVSAMGMVLVMAGTLHAQPPPPDAGTPPADPHAGHAMPSPPPATGQAAPEERAPLPPFISAPTEADRQAAFPDLEGHPAHDNVWHSFVLVDQLERQGALDRAGRINVETRGWVGKDRDRLWFRTESAADDRRVDEMQTHILYGHQFSRWWDVVGGIRQDFRPGSPQTWAAVGIQGLAPYWFEIEATGYLGAGGRTMARFEIEYDLLLTNRLVLQPMTEIELSGKADPERGVAAGLTTTDTGVRLRYQIRREFAPYVGVTWANKHGGTAAAAAAGGEPTAARRLVLGVRLWF